MPKRMRVQKTGAAAHLILGPREEPFLPALLESLHLVADVVIVNDNGPDPSPHRDVLLNNRFAKDGRLFVDRTPFTDFASARNACLRVHRERNAGDWIAFVDSDEVHGPTARNVARRLRDVPGDVDFIDGYTWHFLQSFDWYMSIERRMAFFRYRDDVRWRNPVHEKLEGLTGRRLALPYVYGHYGWVLPLARQAQKERLYATLGAPSDVFDEDQLASTDPAIYFERWWPIALRFRGAHPPEARATIARMRRENAAAFAETDRCIRECQNARDRLRNAVMKANYEQRWRARALDPLARKLCEA